jgi:gamma-glutamylcysteine synthetase
MLKVWKTKSTTITTMVDGEEVLKPYHYVSVNAVTLEPGGEVDLKAWHENGWIFYVENRSKNNKTGMKLAEPFESGIY